MARPWKYPPELLDRGARLVLESGRPIAHVAKDLGVPPETLRRWLRQVQADAGLRPDLPTAAEREEIKALRKEVFELRRANEILKSASVLSERLVLRDRWWWARGRVRAGVLSADALRYLGARPALMRVGDVMVDWSIRLGRLRPLDVLWVAAAGREPFRLRELAGELCRHGAVWAGGRERRFQLASAGASASGPSAVSV